MARLPYADLSHGPAADLAQRIVAERGSVLHLYQMLLHSAPVAEGWLGYLTAIRQKSSLNGALRELVIMRIAHLNRAPYEADQHAPIALREGLRQDQLDALVLPQVPQALFNDAQRAVLAYTDAMTLSVQVPDAVFAAVKPIFSAQELVELTATIAAYNMVSRFLEALQVHSEDAR
ncbi:carboxymuconolactone decarboxylase family protein [Castellaniella sp.]|uniref:carboxymuconolactone decarboxylase family protein n=1 Tax=Castellaniella sp. TaxID=1955812 RepID=UPI002AFEFDE3|nr:carboxymuconolactone decarboxylase family protein [Castellaniella sp.]